jgi:hypothetical protein
MVLKGAFFSPDNGFYSWVCKDETKGTVLFVGPLLDFEGFYLPSTLFRGFKKMLN